MAVTMPVAGRLLLGPATRRLLRGACCGMTVAGRLLRGPRLLRLQGTASKTEDSSRYERLILILWDQSASPAVYKLFFAFDLSDMNEFGNGAA